MAPITRSQTLKRGATVKRFVPTNLKTQLQIDKDQVVRGIGRVGKPWPITRPDKRSTGRKRPWNTCYRIASLQALLHQPLFMQWVLSHDGPEHPCPSREAAFAQYCMACVMKGVISEYWGPRDKQNRQKWRHSERLDDTIGNNHTDSKLRESRHRDTVEMNRLHRVINTVPSINEMGEESDAHECYQEIINQITAKEDACNRDGTAISDALYTLNREICATCHNCDTLFATQGEPSFGLALPFPTSNPSSIEAAISNLFSARHFERQHCPHCNRTTKHLTVTKIEAAPHTLVIHLNIFKEPQNTWIQTPENQEGARWNNHKQSYGYWLSTGPTKHTDPTSYPKVLDLSSHQSNPSSCLRYTLSSVIYHTGTTISAGHYFATAKAPGGVSRMNDQSVERVEARFLNQNPVDVDVGRGKRASGNAYVLTYTMQRVKREGVGYFDKEKGRWVDDIV